MSVNITNNFNVTYNFGFNPQDFRAPPPGVQAGGGFGMALSAGIFALFSRPMGAGPFASAQLPRDFNFTGGSVQQSGFQATQGASWSATLQNEHQGNIDLGDGYTLQLDERNSEIVIKNANTGESTKIWGDPHVDVDGKHAFDFWGTTTFQLDNGTKITINTEQFAQNPDQYVASALTITKGDQAIVVDGISQNKLGDLKITQSNNGQAIDAYVRDGFVLEENANGAGWNSQLTGDIATQADLNLTKVGAAYGPGSGMPSLGEISESLSSFLLYGMLSSLGNEARGARR